ncbi:hypothetical protein JKP88DRAFT_353703 [Tribonema minus]|uniref:EF-hand domain-containing protein n=1 Tax=Tribonema minus TaxID=303371 RepID=A0A835ZC92_9STRA|nr:hypothetical protein JKP88DRAFT_353703 [Tribonema minus]
MIRNHADVELPFTSTGAKSRRGSRALDFPSTAKTFQQKNASVAGQDGMRAAAYKLFTRLDYDINGRITAYELERFLCLALEMPLQPTFDITFTGQDLHLELARVDGRLEVQGWGEDMVGYTQSGSPQLCKGLELLKVQGITLPHTKDPTRSLAGVLRGLAPGKPVTVTFAAPPHIVSPADCWLDLRISGSGGSGGAGGARNVAAVLPTGAYPTREAFASAVQAAARAAAAPTLDDLTCECETTAARASSGGGGSGGGRVSGAAVFVLSTRVTPFQVAWATGANAERCCQAQFGAGVAAPPADTDADTRHVLRAATVASYMGPNAPVLALVEGAARKLRRLMRRMGADTVQHSALYPSAPGAVTHALRICNCLLRLYTRSPPPADAAAARSLAQNLCAEFAPPGCPPGTAPALDFEAFLPLFAARLSPAALPSLVQLVAGRYADAAEAARREDARAAAAAARVRRGALLAARQARKAAQRAQTAAQLGSGEYGRGKTGLLVRMVARPLARAFARTAPPPPPPLPRAQAVGAMLRVPAAELEQRLAALHETRDVARALRRAQTRRAQFVGRRLAQAQRDSSAREQREKEAAAAAQLRALVSMDLLPSAAERAAAAAAAAAAALPEEPDDVIDLGLTAGLALSAGAAPPQCAAEALHPAFTGYVVRRIGALPPWDPATVSPVYFGALSRAHAATRRQSAAAIIRVAKDAVRQGQRRHNAGAQHVWQVFPCAPINKGQVRQDRFAFARAYDRGEVVHPSLFGLSTLRLATAGAAAAKAAPPLPPPSCVTPVMAGYQLRRAPPAALLLAAAGGATAAAATDERDLRYVRALAPGDACPTCLLRKAGCPRCWEYPAGWAARDFAYEGPAGSSGAAAAAATLELLAGAGSAAPPERLPLHTQLTTESAIRLYRSIEQSFIRFLVKALPCGPVTALACEARWPVHALYAMLRAASAGGAARDAFLFLPTTAGAFALDCAERAETDVSLGVHTALLPLARYNLTANRSTVCLLLSPFFSTVKTEESIRQYLSQELVIKEKYSTATVQHLATCPAHPEQDPVQRALVALLSSRAQLHAALHEDDRHRALQARRELISEAARIRAAVEAEQARCPRAYTPWRAANTEPEGAQPPQHAAAAAPAVVGGPGPVMMLADAPQPDPPPRLPLRRRLLPACAAAPLQRMRVATARDALALTQKIAARCARVSVDWVGTVELAAPITLGVSATLNVTGASAAAVGRAPSAVIGGSGGGSGGAAVRLFELQDGSALTLRDVVLRGASGDIGGAMRAGQGSTVRLTRVVAHNNSATDGGGALYLGLLATAEITNSSFDTNMADRGAAVYVDVGARATIVDSSFKNGRGGSGGAIFTHGQLTVRHSSFANNTGLRLRSNDVTTPAACAHPKRMRTARRAA